MFGVVGLVFFNSKLQTKKLETELCRCGSVVEHFLGKEEVEGSIPSNGSSSELLMVNTESQLMICSIAIRTYKSATQRKFNGYSVAGYIKT